MPASPFRSARAAIRTIAAAFSRSRVPALAAKTDVLVLRNGDRLTGEVDVLERGKLQFKMDDMGTLQIEWDKVASVTAKASSTATTSGAGATSALWSPGPQPGELRIVQNDFGITFALGWSF